MVVDPGMRSRFGVLYWTSSPPSVRHWTSQRSSKAHPIQEAILAASCDSRDLKSLYLYCPAGQVFWLPRIGIGNDHSKANSAFARGFNAILLVTVERFEDKEEKVVCRQG